MTPRIELAVSDNASCKKFTILMDADGLAIINTNGDSIPLSEGYLFNMLKNYWDNNS